MGYFLPVLAFGLLFSSGTHARYCLQNWACVDIQKTNEGIEVWLENITPYVYTGTIQLRTSNLTDGESRNNHYTRSAVINGQQKIKVLSLDTINAEKRVRFRDTFEWTPGDMHAEHADVSYALPYPADKYYRIVQGFGGRYSHSGASRYAVDFAMPIGTPVHAARGGVVIDLTEHNWRGGSSRRYARYANFVTILHNDNTTGEYYHLRQNGVVVEVGDYVASGELLGYSGSTGFSSMPHLHFAVYRAKTHGNYQSLPFRFKKR